MPCRLLCFSALFLASLAFASDLPKNTKLEIKLEEMLSSDLSQTGQKFRATLNKTVGSSDVILLEKGAPIEGVVKYAEPTYNYRQPGELDLELVSITSGGRTYFLQTNTIMLAGKPSPIDPRTGRPTESGSRKGDLARGALGTIGGNRDTATTIPGTDISVGAGAGRNGTQVILPVKSKLTFNLTSASVTGTNK
jgi:hypothetical protein